MWFVIVLDVIRGRTGWCLWELPLNSQTAPPPCGPEPGAWSLEHWDHWWVPLRSRPPHAKEAPSRVASALSAIRGLSQLTRCQDDPWLVEKPVHGPTGICHYLMMSLGAHTIPFELPRFAAQRQFNPNLTRLSVFPSLLAGLAFLVCLFPTSPPLPAGLRLKMAPAALEAQHPLRYVSVSCLRGTGRPNLEPRHLSLPYSPPSPMRRTSSPIVAGSGSFTDCNSTLTP